ncbi:hypothetical protein O1611_g1765 [Lasiodiplodia mahajangana]|uniref:Uncharacterized protein n=1 Tax=Lasiodiplodia mahajangana TaxID=1108764 RepID=A0ACC2JWL3_9PEZI|nr:hypothetical protein O1611_g1765 [Lasiodiplodia mahajangana]
MAAQNRIIELSSLIAQKTALIDDYFTRNGLPTPSLDANAPHLLSIPDGAVDIQAARNAVIDACSELKALLTGPRDLLKFKWTAYVSVKAILRFRLDQSFAVGETTSFEAMSKFSGLNVKNVKRIVRHAIINHRFFQEDNPGEITHSALTAVLVNDEVARNGLVVMADAMEKWPNSEENNETGFALANNSTKSMFDIFAENPDRAERFGRFFTASTSPTNELLDAYSWAEKATMVDVGGSHGSVAISIAERFPNMKCIVQDLPDTVAEGASKLPTHLKERVTFMAQPGARIIIHERILPAFEKTMTVEAMRAIDLDIGMQQLLNAREREMLEWPELFSSADSRFRYIGAVHCPDSNLWIIEAEWQGFGATARIWFSDVSGLKCLGGDDVFDRLQLGGTESE